MDIWNEWTVGFQGGPSILSLHEKYDLQWLDAEDRALYRDNRSILLEAEKMARTKRMSPLGALEELESARVKSGVDVRMFAKLLAQAGFKDMETFTKRLQNSSSSTTTEG
ncbi:hypothetical protein B0O80DRAFT_453148 [Mortierella sp. GBAus27b]|nr:hypothetical protein B0O80DRAFT_453148 [Mortierella sp. GBAus27b]